MWYQQRLASIVVLKLGYIRPAISRKNYTNQLFKNLLKEKYKNLSR